MSTAKGNNQKKKDDKDDKKKKQKETEEEKLKKIDLQSSEKIRLAYVFDKLCTFEEEPSSDEDSKEKQYKKKIEQKAKEKMMKKQKQNFESKTMKSNKKQKKFKEDEDEEEEPKEKKPPRKKFSKKALRKVIRTLCNEFAKDELDNMIWEMDENLDGYISEKEFENMYKKCISDEKEEEGKKLFYLVQFLMYDKDEKHEITVEDTLEILCARNPNNVDACLDSIFDIEVKDDKGKVKKVKRETISFLEYTQRMHELSMKKRSEISNRKKIFCDKIQQEAIKEAKERAERKNMEAELV